MQFALVASLYMIFFCLIDSAYYSKKAPFSPISFEEIFFPSSLSLSQKVDDVIGCRTFQNDTKKGQNGMSHFKHVDFFTFLITIYYVIKLFD